MPLAADLRFLLLSIVLNIEHSITGPQFYLNFSDDHQPPIHQHFLKAWVVSSTMVDYNHQTSQFFSNQKSKSFEITFTQQIIVQLNCISVYLYLS